MLFKREFRAITKTCRITIYAFTCLPYICTKKMGQIFKKNAGTQWYWKNSSILQFFYSYFFKTLWFKSLMISHCKTCKTIQEINLLFNLCPGIREPSNLDVTKLVLAGQVLSRAKIVIENSRFFLEKIYPWNLTLIISKIRYAKKLLNNMPFM